MLRIYDKDHKAAGYIKAYKDMKIESVTSTGDKTLSFTYMGKKDIETEYYVQTQEDEYVIKEKTQSMDGFPQYVAVLNLEELEGKPWGSFSVKEATIDEAARLALAGTGWTIGECNVKKKRNAGMLKVTSRDIIEKLAVAFLCEIVYNTKNKTVSFFNEVGEDKGTYFIRGLNLKKLSKKSDSYDYYTQIIPIGANNLTIEKVNDGKNYLENYQYSTKKRAYIWNDDSYTDAQALKEDAELKLQDLSKPAESYSVTVADLAKQKKQYSILEYHVGDKIWLIDSTTRTRVKQRIVKMTEYPQSPEKNTCEIANTVLTFEELQQKYKEAAEIVNTVVSGDGRYTGTVNVSDILNFEQGLSDSDIISGLKNNLDSLNNNYKEIKLTVGSIDTNYLKVEDAKLKYASIDFANIDKAAMEYFYAHSGLIKNVSIGDAAISGELIGVTIKGDLIEGNTVKADKLVIKGSDGLYYKLNTDGMTVEKEQTDYNSINGQVIRAKSVTATKIDVKDLVAFGATIGGFNISENAIYSGLKESVDNPIRGIYMDNNGQFVFGDSSQFVKFYKTSTGEYKLAIAIEDLQVGLTNVSDAINDMDDIKDELVTSLVIESSNGASLDSDTTPAILTVIINYGRTRITDNEQMIKTFGSEVYLEWSYKKSSEENWTVIKADDVRVSDNGFTLSTTKKDLFDQTTFRCQLLGTEHDTLNPDQETVIDRLTNRLNSYVDEILMTDVRKDFETVKDEVISEMNKDTYVAKIENNEKNIAEIHETLKNVGTDIRKGKQRQVGKACLWYHNFYDFGNTDNEAAARIAQNEIVVAGGSLYAGSFTEEDKERQLAIITKAKELNPKLKLFYYITIASWRNDGGWSHILGKGGYWDAEEAAKHPSAVRIHTKWEIFQLLEYAAHIGGSKSGEKQFIETYTWTDDDGASHTEDKYIDLYEGGISLDGCFYDDAGMETEEGRINQGFPAVLREKYIQLVDFTHSKGLAAFPNQLSTDWYADTISTANPNGLPSSIGPDDYMLLESCHSQVGFNGRPLWRHVNGTESVWNYYQNWYGKVGTKVVVNDYLFGTGAGEKLNDEEFYELATYLVCDTLCCGGHYIDLNGLLTWDLPDFFDKLLIPETEEYDIVRKDKGHYILHANGHTLEVVRGDNLTQGETVSEKTLKKVYIYFDGIRINNAFKKIPQYAYETDQRLDVLEKDVNTIQTSYKSTANIYHRMMIDDWGKELVFTNFVSTTSFIKNLEGTAKTGIATVDTVDYETNSIRLTRLNDTQINAYVEIDITDRKGHTLEIGFTVNKVTNWVSWGFNAYAPAAFGWTNMRTSLNATRKSSYYGNDFYGYIRTVTIPEDTEEEKWRMRICYNGSVGEIFDLGNFYVIDVDEYGEDITKDWYTNLISAVDTATNNNDLAICYTVDKIDDYGFDITWNKPENYADWSGLRWDFPNGTFKAGHTYELGFDTYENNAGSANIAFRIYWANNEKWVPKTLSIKSTIYNDTRPGYTFTVPESATKTDGYMTFTNTSANYKNSSGEYYKTSIRGMYLYDVDEENIVIRGEEPSNSFLRICRVTDAKLKNDKKLIGNALYFTDSGNTFVTDFNGIKVDIAGNIYVGAVEAGYTGTPEQFGQDLYALIHNAEKE